MSRTPDRPPEPEVLTARHEARTSAPPPDGSDAALLADVARRYYLQERSKVEIGRELGISRFRVARLLQQARERGIVTITVHVPAPVDDALSRLLASALGLHWCTLVRADAGGQDPRMRRDVAEAAARVLPDLVRPGDRLGLTWSRTVDLMVDALTWLPQCTVIQLAGTQFSATGGSTVEVARRVAQLSGGSAYPVHAPLLLDDAAAAVLRRHPAIAATLAMADDLDVAVISVGAWREGCSTVWDAAGPELRRAGLDAGAVAEVSGRLLDDSGRPVVTALDDMVVGVSLRQLLAARRRVALVAGPHRARAVLAVARAGLVTHLVATTDVAREVLRELDGTTDSGAVPAAPAPAPAAPAPAGRDEGVTPA